MQVSRLLSILIGFHLAALLSCLPQVTFAQATPTEAPALQRWYDTDNHSALVVYPIAFGRNALLLGWHQKTGNRTTLLAKAGLGYGESTTHYASDQENFWQVSAEGQYRAFLNGKPMNGVYAGAYARFRHLNVDGEWGVFYDIWPPIYETERLNLKVQSLSGGVVLGYQLTWHFLTLDGYLGGGPEYSFGDIHRLNTGFALDRYRRAIAFHGGLSVGVRIR
jgi:hypothetical protein